MDPLQTLREILTALADKGADEANELLDEMHNWLDGGGYDPDLSELSPHHARLALMYMLEGMRNRVYEIEAAQEMQAVPEVVTAPPELDEHFDDDGGYPVC